MLPAVTESSICATENRLLASLPSEVRARLRPSFEDASLALGEIVYQPHERLGHVYFPTNCVISLVYTMEDGHTAETGSVGNEGVIGLALFMGGETTPDQAVAQVAGRALRVPADVLRQEFRRGGPLQLALLRHTQALLTQISQIAVCNRLHPIEQRLCRWLLTTRDRMTSNELCFTHDFIAHMLGVRREGIASAASHLQKAGLIHYIRGHIRIVDRVGLEASACECYRVVREESARLLSPASRLFGPRLRTSRE